MLNYALVSLAGRKFPIGRVDNYFEDKVEGPCATITYRIAGRFKTGWVPITAITIKVLRRGQH